MIPFRTAQPEEKVETYTRFFSRLIRKNFRNFPEIFTEFFYRNFPVIFSRKKSSGNF